VSSNTWFWAHTQNGSPISSAWAHCRNRHTHTNRRCTAIRLKISARSCNFVDLDTANSLVCYLAPVSTVALLFSSHHGVVPTRKLLFVIICRQRQHSRTEHTVTRDAAVGQDLTWRYLEQITVSIHTFYSYIHLTKRSSSFANVTGATTRKPNNSFTNVLFVLLNTI